MGQYYTITSYDLMDTLIKVWLVADVVAGHIEVVADNILPLVATFLP